MDSQSDYVLVETGSTPSSKNKKGGYAAARKNYTYKEKELIIQLCKNYPVLRSKKSNSLSVHLKERAWQEITQRYNDSESTQVHRTRQQLKNEFKLLKRRAREQEQAKNAPATSKPEDESEFYGTTLEEFNMLTSPINVTPQQSTGSTEPTGQRQHATASLERPNMKAEVSLSGLPAGLAAIQTYVTGVTTCEESQIQSNSLNAMTLNLLPFNDQLATQALETAFTQNYSDSQNIFGTPQLMDTSDSGFRIVSLQGSNTFSSAGPTGQVQDFAFNLFSNSFGTTVVNSTPVTLPRTTTNNTTIVRDNNVLETTPAGFMMQNNSDIANISDTGTFNATNYNNSVAINCDNNTMMTVNSTNALVTAINNSAQTSKRDISAVILICEGKDKGVTPNNSATYSSSVASSTNRTIPVVTAITVPPKTTTSRDGNTSAVISSNPQLAAVPVVALDRLETTPNNTRIRDVFPTTAAIASRDLSSSSEISTIHTITTATNNASDGPSRHISITTDSLGRKTSIAGSTTHGNSSTTSNLEQHSHATTTTSNNDQHSHTVMPSGDQRQTTSARATERRGDSTTGRGDSTTGRGDPTTGRGDSTTGRGDSTTGRGDSTTGHDAGGSDKPSSTRELELQLQLQTQLENQLRNKISSVTELRAERDQNRLTLLQKEMQEMEATRQRNEAVHQLKVDNLKNEATEAELRISILEAKLKTQHMKYCYYERMFKKLDE